MDAAPPPSVPEEPPTRDWSLLPLDVLASVFVWLGAFEVLCGAGLVCRSWLDAAKVPEVWRIVDLKYVSTSNSTIEFDDFSDSTIEFDDFPNSTIEFDDFTAMAKAAVDRSDGQLRVFSGDGFVTEELTQYIVERSPSLTSLRIVSCVSHVFSAITELPLRELRYLELDDVRLTVKDLIAVLENCPLLEVLTVHDCSGMYEDDEQVLRAKFARIKTLKFECYDDDFGGCCCGDDY